MFRFWCLFLAFCWEERLDSISRKYLSILKGKVFFRVWSIELVLLELLGMGMERLF